MMAVAASDGPDTRDGNLLRDVSVTLTVVKATPATLAGTASKGMSVQKVLTHVGCCSCMDVWLSREASSSHRRSVKDAPVYREVIDNGALILRNIVIFHTHSLCNAPSLSFTGSARGHSFRRCSASNEGRGF